MTTRKTKEAQLFELTMSYLDNGELPPAATIMLVHHVFRHFASTTRTAAEWRNDDDALIDLVVRIEAGVSRRTLADRLDRRMGEGELTADDVEQVALDELERLAEQMLNTWGAMLNWLSTCQPDDKVSTLELVGVGLLDATF